MDTCKKPESKTLYELKEGKRRCSGDADVAIWGFWGGTYTRLSHGTEDVQEVVITKELSSAVVPQL